MSPGLSQKMPSAEWCVVPRRAGMRLGYGGGAVRGGVAAWEGCGVLGRSSLGKVTSIEAKSRCFSSHRLDFAGE